MSLYFLKEEARVLREHPRPRASVCAGGGSTDRTVGHVAGELGRDRL